RDVPEDRRTESRQVLMPAWTHDGLEFYYREAGQGLPFVFQHGLGGDSEQTFGLFKPPPGVRLLTLEARAHGRTRPVGDEQKISLTAFAADLAAWMDHLALPQAVVGGISMGAAVALRFALEYPERLIGLVLSRPAWLDRPNPDNVRVFAEIARLLREHTPQTALAHFEQSETYQRTLSDSPDAAASLLGQFTQPRAVEAVARLERIPADAPAKSLDELRRIRVPTLVLANRQDPIHPFEYGRTLAGAIDGARFAELTPKSQSIEAHAADVARALGEFLDSLPRSER
ncbi:MAG: alpha/beta hydrolase, partial [Pirellulales bacterium]